MHTYSCDGKRQKTVYAFAFALAIPLAYICHVIMVRFSIPWYIDSPSILGLFGLIVVLYNTVLWKISFCGFRLGGVPDYNGIWKGHLISSFNNESFDCTLEIRQTWNCISCKLLTGTSKSYSYAASIEIKSFPSEGLTWLYSNTPNKDAPKELRIHNGVARVELKGTTKIEGEYYNCARDRCTYGTLSLSRID